MIYRKEANFPYPILTSSNNAYINNTFSLLVSLKEDYATYRFELEYEIGSDYIKKLIQQKKAVLMLVVQAKDNKVFNLKFDQSFVEIKKSRITLSKRTKIQLLVRTQMEIDFGENDDLEGFYSAVKENIVVPKYAVIGYSEVVIFDGSSRKPLNIIEKKIDPNLKSDIGIELGSETIIIKYKSNDLQFIENQKCNELNYPYIYMGLQKAFDRFVRVNGGEEESVSIDSMEPPEDSLDLKLYNLCISKMVDCITYDNIDEVIYKITDRILDKYTRAVKGLSDNEN